MRGGAARRGKTPRTAGEGWMWQSGEAGRWPAPVAVGESSGTEGADDEAKVDVGGGAGRLIGSGHQHEVGPEDDVVGEVNTLQDLAGLDGDDHNHDHDHDHGHHWRDGGDAETGALVDALVGMVAEHE